MTTVNTVARIRDWLDNHAGLKIIEPRLIARDLRGVDAPVVTNALMMLVHEGALLLVYKVVSPSGAYADGEFTDPRDVPLKTSRSV